jgi:hypothetical protein
VGVLNVDYRDTEGKPKEACGVFGLYSRELSGELAQRTYFGLYALQHRGQESAGIAVSDGERTTAMRDMGLVSQPSRPDTWPSATSATRRPAPPPGRTPSPSSAAAAT